MSPVLKTSRSLSPTRSTMPWKSRLAEMPCWMLLMIASSFARCVDLGCVRSSTLCSRDCDQRALSIATAAWLASMASRSRSESWKRPNSAVDVRVEHADELVRATSGATMRERCASSLPRSGEYERDAMRERRTSASEARPRARAPRHPRRSAPCEPARLAPSTTRERAARARLRRSRSPPR